MLLSLLLLVFLVAYVVRGWLRGLVLEVVDLVGIVGVVVAVATVGTAVGGGLGRLLRLELLELVLVAGLLFAGVVGVLRLTRWVARNRLVLPGAGGRLEGAAGATFGAVWALVFATGLLVLSVSVPGAQTRTIGPVCDAPLARFLIGDGNPVVRGGERFAELVAPSVLWVGRHLGGPFTLAATAGAPAGGATSAGVAPAGALLASEGDPAARPSTATAVCAPEARARLLAASTADRVVTFAPVAASQLAVDDEAAAAVLSALNAARAEAGLPPLARDAALARVAQAHGVDMYLRGYFAHDTPECRMPEGTAACRDPFDRMRAAGIGYDVAGENLALAPSAASAHQGLMDSPTHRANILGADYTRVGIAALRGPFGLMVVQEFTG